MWYERFNHKRRNQTSYNNKILSNEEQIPSTNHRKWPTLPGHLKQNLDIRRDSISKSNRKEEFHTKKLWSKLQ